MKMAKSISEAACLLLMVACLFYSAAASLNVLQPTATGPGFSSYDLIISLSEGSPDCFQRTVVLINGMQTPTIEVEAMSMLHVNIINKIPPNFPSVSEGISIHWHGLYMRGNASWYDGVPYTDQCPIRPGSNFTYKFLVDEIPGTYFWHDHSFALKADGLQGALIVRPPAGMSEPYQYDEEHVLFINDWWHTEANIMAMRLNRPFDPAQVTNNTGAWTWVGNPQAILINGNGYYNDCQLFPGTGGSTTPPACNASTFTVPPGRSAIQPWAADTNPGCTHESFAMEAGKTYRFRIISGAELVYTTVCFEGHDVTLVATDIMPIQPIQLTNGCVDVNVGQRMDVLVSASNPVGNYWVSVQSQYRTGSPAGFGVLSYNASAPNAFPPRPTPQPTVAPWPLNFTNAMLMAPQLLTPNNTDSSWAMYQSPDYAMSSLVPPSPVTHTYVVEFSQPIFNGTGILRWALDNVMTPTTPMCDAIRANIQKDPKWLDSKLAGPGYGTGQQSLNTTTGPSKTIRVFELGKGEMPQYPTIGAQVISIESNDVVDIVLQNNPANSFNGDYTPTGASRTAMEQHPFHLHGHHFWVLYTGSGVYDASNRTMVAALNTVNPVMRDTVTVPPGGYVVIRFLANNPGQWPLHCHILWHHFMGQQLSIVESPRMWTPQPKKFPYCPSNCIYNTNPYTKSYVNKKYGYTGYPLP